MPAALCAMDRALIVLVREGNVLLWEEFRDEFKKDFWRSLPLGLLFGGLLFLGYFLLSLGMGNFGTFLGPMFFAFGLFTVGFALGRGSYAFLMRELIEITQAEGEAQRRDGVKMTAAEREREIAKLEKEMRAAAKQMEYEYAAVLRDRIIELRGKKD